MGRSSAVSDGSGRAVARLCAYCDYTAEVTIISGKQRDVCRNHFRTGIDASLTAPRVLSLPDLRVTEIEVSWHVVERPHTHR